MHQGATLSPKPSLHLDEELSLPYWPHCKTPRRTSCLRNLVGFRFEGSECRVEPGGSFQTRVPIFYSQRLVAYHRGAETGLAFVKRELCGDHEGVGPCPIDSIFLMCLKPIPGKS